jgi:triphosphoribosyl-dephospho-CoA synthase
VLSDITRLAPPPVSARAYADAIARAAIRCLYDELALTPKPGLVCPSDNGSHADMSAATLLRSLFTLRRYFHAVTLAGLQDRPFAELQRLGIAAEARMLTATKGVNTHRGAIFNLGLLAAASGYLHRRRECVTALSLARVIRTRWSHAICEMRPVAPSHGLTVAARYGVGGARLEAARGYPTIFNVALPALREALGTGLPRRNALVQTLFVLIANLEDTNLLYRGGIDGLRFAQATAQTFLAEGGTARSEWEARARAARDAFVARRLSPGGAADLLAATLFVDTITS